MTFSYFTIRSHIGCIFMYTMWIYFLVHEMFTNPKNYVLMHEKMGMCFVCSSKLVNFSLSEYKDMGLAISSRYLLLNHSVMKQQKP